MSLFRDDVVVSVGHNNFHLLFSAAELASRGRLSCVLTGAYPTPLERRLLQTPLLSRMRKFSKFVNRHEDIPDNLVRQNRVSEAVSALGIRMQRYPVTRARGERLLSLGLHLYGHLAENRVRAAAARGAKIYHYRAGYGQSSVAVARNLGMRLICDHSIIHPSLLAPLIEGGGCFPDVPPAPPVTGLWADVLTDIERADTVLVNSEFVARTFHFMGVDPARISVIYQGVEDKFLSCLPPVRNYWDDESARPPRILFAGGLSVRKGLATIQAALARPGLPPFELHLAGSMAAQDQGRFRPLLEDPRVRYHGHLSQAKLAALMSRSDIFLFPSLAEGSARVVFEAMAAGCAVITTENAGTVVKEGENGWIIPPGSVDALAERIAAVVKDAAGCSVIGRSNRSVIPRRFGQTAYGDALEALYGGKGRTAVGRKPGA